MPLEPKHEAVVCPWTTGNPRHDHQLIFPLDSERLILVWCEYYVRKPSGVARTVYDETGQSGDALQSWIWAGNGARALSVYSMVTVKYPSRAKG